MNWFEGEQVPEILEDLDESNVEGSTENDDVESGDVERDLEESDSDDDSDLESDPENE